MQVDSLQVRPMLHGRERGAVDAHQRREDTNETGRAALAVVGLVLAAGLYCAGAVMNGRSGLLIGCFSALIFTGLSYEAVLRLLPSMFGPRVILLTFAVQPITLVIILISGGSTVPNGTIGIDLSEHVDRICTSQILVLVGTVSAVLVARALSAGRTGLQGGDAFFLRPPAGSQWLILVATTLLLLRHLLPGVPGSTLRYGLAILTAPLGFVPFVAGRLGREYQSVRRACLIILILCAFLGFLMGTRQGITNIALYIIGAMTLLRGAGSSEVAIIRVGLVAPLLLYIGTVVGTVRNQVGRDSLALLEPAQLAQTLAMAEFRFENGGFGADQLGKNGVSRPLAWSDAAVVILSPDTIPYRGLGSFFEEIPQYAVVWGGSSEDGERYLANDLGAAPANRYGFLVNTETSAGFGMVADGWSRGGALGVILVCYVFTTFIIGVEALIFRVRELAPQSKVLLFCIAMNSALMVSAFPLLTLLRALIFQSLLWALLLTSKDIAHRSGLGA